MKDTKVDDDAVTHASSAKVSGWTDSPNTPQTLTFDNIDVGGVQEGLELSLTTVGSQQVANFILGFAFNCGNEVLYEHVQAQGQNSETPVPEPASLLLLGTGLVGLAGCGRRKRRA